MKTENKAVSIVKNIHGRIAPPLILWILGVPGSVCIVLWAIFWRE